jgi:FdhD protein
MNSTYEIPIIKIIEGREEEILDQVAAETAFTLYLNNEVLVSLLCSPMEVETMAIGFLLSEGILCNREQLQDLKVEEETSVVRVKLKWMPESIENLFNKKTIASGCGQGITFTDGNSLRSAPFNHSKLKVRSGSILNLLKDFRKISELYLNTGGVHSAAFADEEKILLFSEDLGRHNAVDKLIGKAFLNKIEMKDKILLSSGRISGEIMTKVVRNQIPILVSRTAPTCMSINYAEEYGVTLIGFARGRRMNIYTHPMRIIACDNK